MSLPVTRCFDALQTYKQNLIGGSSFQSHHVVTLTKMQSSTRTAEN